METDKLTFFGTSAASPSKYRGFSCVGVTGEKGELVLLDCGDGAIRNLLKFNVDVNSISGVLISHYHSDHVTGLTQIIETMGIRKRKSDLIVFGPPGLNEYFSTIQKITNVAAQRSFRLEIVELSGNKRFDVSDFSARTYEMDHSIPCFGYRIVSPRGSVIAYTGDTMPCASLSELGRDADVLIHEATYLHKDLAKAKPPKHSTAKEAGLDARSAGAKKLILTHVNEEYETPEQMVLEAKAEFSNVLVASDGLTIDVDQS